MRTGSRIFIRNISENVAIAVSGSLVKGSGDTLSDVDLSVYLAGPLSQEQLNDITSDLHSISLTIGPGVAQRRDLVPSLRGGRQIEINYYHARLLERQIEDIMLKCMVCMGRTTEICANIRDSNILFDPSGWFLRVKSLVLQPYPDKLKDEITKQNWQALSHPLGGIRTELEKACERQDSIYWQFLMVSFMAAYFDIVLASNKLFHPGIKRIVKEVRRLCQKLPDHFDDIVLFGGATLGREALAMADLLLLGLFQLVQPILLESEPRPEMPAERLLGIVGL